MSARDKTGLGYSTQLNELSSNHEIDSENSLSIFDVRSSDEENTLENDRFSKNGYKVVLPPITGNFLTPRADISFVGSTKKPKSASESVVSNPKIDRDRVIIEDWNSDDKEEEYEVKTVRPETQTVKTKDDKSGQNSKKQGIGFRKVKACFVCKSTDHLIKDLLTRTGLHRPIISTARPVSTARLSVSTVRPVSTARPSVSTARPVKTARPSVSTVRPIYIAKPSVSTARPDYTAKPSVSTTRPVYATRPIYPRMDNGNSEILLQDHAVVDSGCSSHMTSNKAYLSDYEDFNGGFVAFGSDPNGAPRKDDVYSLDLKNIVSSGGLKKQLNHNVKIIRCDNGTKFKNHAMNEFCAKKGIKREFSVARTPQQNGVAERKNKTLIEAARTMLAYCLLCTE
ncbi:putative ribonuclease H-like domain-containing protein [Tanacetum coccineum]